MNYDRLYISRGILLWKVICPEIDINTLFKINSKLTIEFLRQSIKTYWRKQ